MKDQESNRRPHTPCPAALPVEVEQWVHGRVCNKFVWNLPNMENGLQRRETLLAIQGLVLSNYCPIRGEGTQCGLASTVGLRKTQTHCHCSVINVFGGDHVITVVWPK